MSSSVRSQGESVAILLTGFRLQCVILHTNNSVESINTNRKTILLCATNHTK